MAVGRKTSSPTHRTVHRRRTQQHVIDTMSTVSSSSPKYRRRPLPIHTRSSLSRSWSRRWWPRVFILLVALRLVSYLWWWRRVDLPKRVLETPQLRLGNNHNRPAVAALPSLVDQERRQEQEWMRQQAMTRKERTTPPAPRPIVLPRRDAWSLLGEPTLLPVGTDQDWPVLCRQANLTSASRVLLTGGALTQPMAVGLALLLHQQCGVETITGADVLFPNRRRLRLAAAQGYRLLLRSMAEFTLRVPWFGLRRKDGSRQWINDVRSTHIVHFNVRDKQVAWETNMLADQERLYSLQHDLQTWYDVLESVSRRKQRHPNEATPRILHVSLVEPPAVHASRISPILSSVHEAMNNMIVTHLQLAAPVVGPYIDNDDDDKSTNVMHVQEALAAVLTALGPSLAPWLRVEPRWLVSRAEWQQALMSSSNDTTLTSRRAVETRIWQQYGSPPSLSTPSPLAIAKPPDYLITFGAYEPRYPCPSTCSSLLPCLPSVWDGIAATSRSVTASCDYVVYGVFLTEDLDQLVLPRGYPAAQLCRVAFVSGKSVLVRDELADKLVDGQTLSEALQLWNGKIQSNQWTLIWLPSDDESTLSDADLALLRIDPRGMFADSVQKALYVETQELAVPADSALLRVLSQIDRPALGERSRREQRSGTEVARWVKLPPERARQSIFFAGEPAPAYQPKNAAAFVQLAGPDFYFPSRQVAFYDQVAHLVQTNDMRPEDETRSTIYFSFPYQWISMAILVHDFQHDASRQFRCSWYHEYLYWGGNRNAEELTFAFVMAKHRIQGKMGPFIEDEDSWQPLLLDDETRRPNGQGGDLFVRLMRKRNDAK